ncbi:hypothetical protein [Bacteroides sp. 519]|uniref:hypothetical protein n=1 Tax=Bacteroides sp. 519 TaxID=2302937 RepID=UPI0013D4DE59|nr:hypothetical protein [Bacteroides sp. 519]NDV57745.1 hypothetical protein [Bacteroides sp. 519]
MMMKTKKFDLHKEFLKMLHNLPGKRSELINEIADELSIERESAYRRLSGRVLFSASEIGLLVRRFNISLDDMTKENPLYSTVTVMMSQPMTRRHSMDMLIRQMENSLNKINKSVSENGELYSVFDSLPIEFFLPYPNLCKFMFFKWGYCYIGTEDYYKYKDWVLPEKIHVVGEKLLEACKKYSKVLYIWDYPVIWNLVNDITFFYNILVLSDEDVAAIKADLRDLLINLERLLKGGDNHSYVPELSVYFSTVNISITCLAHISDTECHSFFRNYFFQTENMNNPKTSGRVRDWIQSMKSLSTCISESSERERRLFFERQHKMLK